jgi:hypothetical protein
MMTAGLFLRAQKNSALSAEQKQTLGKRNNTDDNANK